ncbi:MarR family winged helix-turn-helix transcriptional regulator [Pelotomaculum propionicicum]|nr:MarR family transcriptional regulator [Pelotomaculum propionicicum]
MTRNCMSHAQFRAVSMLCRKGSMSMSEMAKEMKISKQQLTPIVYKLISHGLLVRKTDENDRRVVRIEVTEKGRSMYEKLLPAIKMSLVEKFKKLPAEELAELDQMLKRTQEILNKVEQE